MTGVTAEIALEGASFSFDRLYTYTVPPVLFGSALPGCRVLVPFGRGNTKKQGIISLLFSFIGEKVCAPCAAR